MGDGRLALSGLLRQSPQAFVRALSLSYILQVKSSVLPLFGEVIRLFFLSENAGFRCGLVWAKKYYGRYYYKDNSKILPLSVFQVFHMVCPFFFGVLYYIIHAWSKYSYRVNFCFCKILNGGDMRFLMTGYLNT